jgi:hypothetical protein
MTRFFTRLFATRKPAAARPARRASLSVEPLETRETPSSVSFTSAEPLNVVRYKTLRREIKRDLLTLAYLPASEFTRPC